MHNIYVFQFIAVFIFIILPLLIAMYTVFKLAIAHVNDLKKQSERLKTKSIQENNNAPIY